MEKGPNARAVKFKGSPFARVNIWSPDQKLVYSSDHKLVGTNIEPSDELVETLDGNEPTTEILGAVSAASRPRRTTATSSRRTATSRCTSRSNQTRATTTRSVRGLPPTPIAQTIRADTNRLYLILMSLLYAIGVAQAAHAPRKEMSAHLERTKL